MTCTHDNCEQGRVECPSSDAATRNVLRELLAGLWSPVVRWVWVFAATWGAVIAIVVRQA